MNNKFKINIFIVILILLLTSCSQKEIETNKYDNSSFYNGKHKIVETDIGYYNLYRGILTFIDKETLKPYIFGNERNDINTLLNDEDKLNKSESYFNNADEVFFEDGKIYISSYNYIKQIDEKNNTIKTFDNMGSSDQRILNNGVFYYNPSVIDPNKEKFNIIEKFDTKTGKYEEFVDLNDKLREIDFTKIDIQKLYVNEKTLYIYTILSNETKSASSLITINLDNKKVDFNLFDDIKGFEFSGFYFENENLIKNFTPFDKNDEKLWAKNSLIYIKNNNKSEVEPLKVKVYSDKDSIKSSFPALSIYKSYGLQDNGLENTDFTINQGNLTYKLSNELFLKNNEFNVILSNSDDILLSYSDGNLKILRAGEVYDIYK